MNLYAYVEGDPVNWIDSSGLFIDGGVSEIYVAGVGTAVVSAWLASPQGQAALAEAAAGIERVYTLCKNDFLIKVAIIKYTAHVVFQETDKKCDGNCENGDYTEPQDLEEQLALDEAKAGEGEPFMGDKVNDPRYKDTHDKMRHNHPNSDGTNTEIHYWKNRDTGETSGFKFKNHPNSRKRRYQ